jgi:glucokinase
MPAALLAIEIGGTKLQMFVGDATGRIRQRHRFPVEVAQGGAGIRRQMEAALDRLLKDVSPAALGVGFGGPVDWRNGIICCSHQVEGWADFGLEKWLRDVTGRPVVVENDSNSAALGEAVCGAGRGFNPAFYFNMGSGVGGGLVVDGRIYHGAKPGEVEFGHLRLDRGGTTVESRCSGWAVDRRIRALVTEKPGSLLARLVGATPGGEAKHLTAALQEGDREARRLLEETAADLGFALSHVVHLFHPEVVVVGGGLSLLGEPLRAAVERALREHVMEAFQPGPVVRLAELQEDAVPAGALLLAGALVAAPNGAKPRS